jgi:hypothetical protein
VQADDEAVTGRARRSEAEPRQHVGMGEDLGRDPPPSLDLLGRPGRQRDHRAGVREQRPQLLAVQVVVVVMRVAQVVDGHDQRHALRGQRVADRLELRRRLGIEAEVDMEDVEVRRVGGDPARVQHDRRPPAAGNLLAVRGGGVGQPHHRVAPVVHGEMPHVHVARRHRGHANGADRPVGWPRRRSRDLSTHCRALPRTQPRNATWQRRRRSEDVARSETAPSYSLWEVLTSQRCALYFRDRNVRSRQLLTFSCSARWS